MVGRLMFRIELARMEDLDQKTLSILRDHCDPLTGHSNIKLVDLARLLSRHEVTVWTSLKRLEGAGHIKRHPHRGRRGIDIEVLLSRHDRLLLRVRNAVASVSEKRGIATQDEQRPA